MKPRLFQSWVVPSLALVGALMAARGTAHAEVTNVVLTSCVDVLGGKSWGQTGAYERCKGKIFYALDPSHPRNQIIVDLDKAPRNAKGQVEFSSDLTVLRPKDPSRGNGVLFFDIINRGNQRLLATFNLASAADDPTTEAHFGDGFLMREGYTLIAVGWEFAPNNPVVALYPPIASDNGRPITGEFRTWWIPDEATRSRDMTIGPWTGVRVYPPLDPRDPSYTLTERMGFHGEPHVVPRETWEFGRLDDDRVVYDPHYLTLWTGFRPGYLYEITYQTKDPRVAGAGFAAIRDAASYFKYNPASPVRGRYVYTTGSSQTGRMQRQLIYEGFTIDEEGRKAVDAVFVQTGGASLGSFNRRFGQPNEGGFHTETWFPLLYQTTRDPATGRMDGLGARIPDGLHPKVFLFETASEYYDRGRVAALNHTSIDGEEDMTLAENVRFFVVGSYPHGRGPYPPVVQPSLQQRDNPIDARPLTRGLLTALDRWVREDVEPPPSKHPTLAAGTLVSRDEVRFPDIPGVQWPRHVPGGYRSDLAGKLEDNPVPFLVSQVDSDGNELDGLLLPDVLVPLATYAGWGFRSPRVGAPDQLMYMRGSYVPFPRTRTERAQRGDPRPSIEERYSGRADYLRRYEEATRKLIAERYLLADDLGIVVERAADHWDWLMNEMAEEGS